jgi:hypothetical protein
MKNLFSLLNGLAIVLHDVGLFTELMTVIMGHNLGLNFTVINSWKTSNLSPNKGHILQYISGE